MWNSPQYRHWDIWLVLQEYMERHVGFTDSGEEEEDEQVKVDGKLRRRDTLHYLKNKKISSGKDDAEERVRGIF